MTSTSSWTGNSTQEIYTYLHPLQPTWNLNMFSWKYMKMLVLGLYCLGRGSTIISRQSSAPRQAGGPTYGIEFVWADVRIICCSLLLIITTNILDGWLKRMKTRKNNLRESTAMTCKSVITSHLKGTRGNEYKVHLSQSTVPFSSANQKGIYLCPLKFGSYASPKGTFAVQSGDEKTPSPCNKSHREEMWRDHR